MVILKSHFDIDHNQMRPSARRLSISVLLLFLIPVIGSDKQEI